MSQEIETRMSQCNQKLRSIFEEQNENRMALQNQERAEAVFMNGKIEVIVYLTESRNLVW